MSGWRVTFGAKTRQLPAERARLLLVSLIAREISPPSSRLLAPVLLPTIIRSFDSLRSS